MVSIEDVMKLDLKVAVIKDVKDHPNADRLYLLTIDDGAGERQLVAGIRRGYEKEALIGQQVVFVANLEPAVIRGETSNGMILAASDDETLAIVQPQKMVKPGSRVK